MSRKKKKKKRVGWWEAQQASSTGHTRRREAYHTVPLVYGVLTMAKNRTIHENEIHTVNEGMMKRHLHVLFNEIWG